LIASKIRIHKLSVPIYRDFIPSEPPWLIVYDKLITVSVCRTMVEIKELIDVFDYRRV